MTSPVPEILKELLLKSEPLFEIYSSSHATLRHLAPEIFKLFKSGTVCNFYLKRLQFRNLENPA